MINKSMIGLQSRKNILLIFGMTTVALLISASSFQMISASVEGGAPVSSASKSNQSAAEGCSPEEPICNHINQAQSALQNGDTAGAQMHMDLAKQALGCSPLDPQC